MCDVSRTARTLVALAGACAALASRAVAQGLVGAAADTVDPVIQAAHRDYTRYTPEMCARAVETERFKTVRVVGLSDSAAYRAERDTLPAASVAVARECGRHLAPERVTGDALYYLAQLSLAAGDDARAGEAAERWLAGKGGDAAAQAWRMLDVLWLYTDARPARYAAADTLMARLDALGKPAAAARLVGHGVLLAHARRRFDVPRMEREALAALALDADAHAALGNPTPDAYAAATTVGQPVATSPVMSLIEVAMYRSPGAPAAGLERMLATVRQAGTPFPEGVTEMIKAIEGMNAPATLPPFPVKYWINGSGWPVPGKVSLLLRAPGTVADNYRWLAIFRRLRKKYGDKLNITLFVSTQGQFKDGPPLAPAQEADAIGKYYTDFLKLPVSVAVEESAVNTLPDGRIERNPSAFMAQVPPAYTVAGPFSMSMTLVDQQGKLLLRGWLPVEEILDAYIGHALGATSATPAAAPAANAMK